MLKFLPVVALSLVACKSQPLASEVRPYPLETCIVMDSELGTMGDPVVRVYEGQEVKFCCEPCVEEFESDPEFYMAKLNGE